ncbi:MAG: hypothetical protein KIS61_00710 [Candidatus Eremiobacteraeota bacterium]|nr:hypothetical protein [Candidatus Eremiobacteraeota bacterium]
MQKIYLPGEKKKAVCPTCEGLVDATFRYGVYVHSDGTDVPNVLMLYCDQCDTQLAHAHQSSYLIQKARRSDQSQRTSVRVPQALIDMASSQIHSLGGVPKTVSALDLIIKAIVSTLFGVTPAKRKKVLDELQKQRAGPFWNLSPGRLVPLHLSQHAKAELGKLAIETNLKNRSEIVRASILLAAQDHPLVAQELRKMVLLS